MSQSPRVTVVTPRLDVNGTERHLTHVLPALQRRGIDITLYVMERGGSLLKGYGFMRPVFTSAGFEGMNVNHLY